MSATAGASREEAVGRLFTEHGARMYQLALRFCGSPEEAEDLVQDVFLQAFRKWDQFEGRSAPGTWLYTIAARRCQRRQRRRSGEPERVQSVDESLPFGEARIAVLPSPDEGPLGVQLRAESVDRIQAALADLPHRFRMPLVLVEIAGLSLADAAAVLGLKEATIKTRLHRARIVLRRALEATLPRRRVPPPIFSREVCLDLLGAKQEALDRGLEFEFPGGVVCERCAELFATLDLTRDACREAAKGRLPESLQAAVLARLAENRG